MKEKEIDTFEKIQSQLEGLHSEISALSKRSQNDALNKFKLKFVNQVLIESNSFLGKDYKPFLDFNKFDENDIPTNSDVTMILAQYLSCFEKLRADNVITYAGEWYWKVDGNRSNIQTSAPRKIKDK